MKTEKCGETVQLYEANEHEAAKVKCKSNVEHSDFPSRCVCIRVLFDITSLCVRKIKKERNSPK